MKKLIFMLTALALAASLTLPAFAANGSSPATGDISSTVVIALIVAAVAIVATVLFSIILSKRNK